jgi:hypothetical protein
MKAPYHCDVTQQIFSLSAIPLCTKRNGTVMLQSSSLAFRKPLQYKNSTYNVASVSVFINTPGCRKHFEIAYKDHSCPNGTPFHAVKSDFSVKVSVVNHT